MTYYIILYYIKPQKMLMISNCVKDHVNNQPGWFRCLSITCSEQPISIVDADPNIQRHNAHTIQFNYSKLHFGGFWKQNCRKDSKVGVRKGKWDQHMIQFKSKPGFLWVTSSSMSMCTRHCCQTCTNNHPGSCIVLLLQVMIIPTVR